VHADHFAIQCHHEIGSFDAYSSNGFHSSISLLRLEKHVKGVIDSKELEAWRESRDCVNFEGEWVVEVTWMAG